jgi:hypothetical protein
MSLGPLITFLRQVEETPPPWVGAVVNTLTRLETILNRMETNMSATSADLTARIAALTADVEAERSVEERAITLLTGLSQVVSNVRAQLAAGGVEPAQLAALDQLDAAVNQNRQALAAAVAAATPAEPAAPVVQPAPTEPAAPVVQPTPAPADSPAPQPQPAATPADPNAPQGPQVTL